MSQHGYMRHTATPPLVLEIGQKLWQNCPFLPTYASLGNPFLHSFSTFSTTGLDPWTLAVLCFLGHVDLSLVYGVQN